MITLSRRRLSAVPDRVDAMRRFLRAVEDHVPDQRLTAARTVVERAGERLRLSGDHCVVALAGATGSGKSSLFNALATLELSQVGVRRPTTGDDSQLPLTERANPRTVLSRWQTVIGLIRSPGCRAHPTASSTVTVLAPAASR